jgi:hypothetical protein
VFGSSSDLAAWLEASTSWDGHERQRAVVELGRRMDAQALPALLVRANDWVPQVRREAREAVFRFIEDGYIEAWLLALPQLEALYRARRTQHGELIEAVEALLSKPAHLGRLVSALREPSRFVRRWLFGLHLKAVRSEAEHDALLAAALKGTDIAVAVKAWAEAQGAASSERRLSLAAAACASRFASLRIGGLRWAAALDAEAATSLLRARCFDPSAGVRALAFASLSGADRAVVLSLAVSRFGDAQGAPRDRSTALALLSLANHPEAESFCRAACASSAPVLRRAGYAGLLAAASAVSLDGLILEVMSDPSAKVRRLAVEKVKRGAPAPDTAALLALARSDAGLLRQVLQLAALTSPWQRLLVLLQLLVELSAESQQRVLATEAARWCVDAERCFLAPSVRQREALATHWQRARALLPVAQARRMVFHLEQFKVSVS